MLTEGAIPSHGALGDHWGLCANGAAPGYGPPEAAKMVEFSSMLYSTPFSALLFRPFLLYVHAEKLIEGISP